MSAFRIAVAALLALCAVPVAVMAVAWLLAAMSGCPLQFETPHVCSLAAWDIGWLLDGLVPFGVWGALTFGAGVYIFAGWVSVELAVIVLSAVRRG
jgi:hypothetical protein